MIPKIILGKGVRATRCLVGYPYGPGSANEHADPRMPGRPPPRRDHDIRAVQREARKIEADLGLRRLNFSDGSATKRPTSKKHFKAAPRPPRPARSCACAYAAPWSCLYRDRVLRPAGGDRPESPSQDRTVRRRPRLQRRPARRPQQAWRSCVVIRIHARDLSLPKIRHRLTDIRPEPVTARPTDPWHQAIAATDRIPDHLTHGDDYIAQGQLVALGGVLDALPLAAPAAAEERARTCRRPHRCGLREALAPHHQHAQQEAADAGPPPDDVRPGRRPGAGRPRPPHPRRRDQTALRPPPPTGRPRTRRPHPPGPRLGRPRHHPRRRGNSRPQPGHPPRPNVLSITPATQRVRGTSNSFPSGNGRVPPRQTSDPCASARPTPVSSPG